MTLLDAMIEAARIAGDEVLRIRGAGFVVHSKADESPVTAADQAAETIILAHLARAAPGVPVVAEEQAASGAAPVVAGRFFLVDPLDGTKEFVAGRDEFTVNIALVEAGVPVLGVVGAPALGRMFAGDVARREAFELRTLPDVGRGPAAAAAREGDAGGRARRGRFEVPRLGCDRGLAGRRRRGIARVRSARR